MDREQNDTPRSTAIEQLQRLGLSTYAARTFVALAMLRTATAKEVSQVADVPRTRVYDAMEELHEYGLVDIQQSTPRRFYAVSAETTVRKFDRELTRWTELLSDALDTLEPMNRSSEQRGVWTVEGQSTITDRVLAFFEEAETEIVYMTIEGLLTDEIVDGLAAAGERGVDIKLAGSSPAVYERVSEEVPGVERFESLWSWSQTPAGRLLMTDRRATLVSVRTTSAVDRSETAIWGAGERNSLVVVLRALFAWRLGGENRV